MNKTSISDKEIIEMLQQRKPAIINQDFEDATQDMIASAKDTPADPTENEIDPAYSFDTRPVVNSLSDIIKDTPAELKQQAFKRDYLDKIDRLIDLMADSLEESKHMVYELSAKILASGIEREATK